MTRQTHTSTSLALAIPILILTHLIGLFAIIGVLIGAVLPDIDSPNSYISRRIPIIPSLIQRKFKHREEVHSLTPFIILILVSITLKLLQIFNVFNSNIPVIIAFTISLGYLFHLCGDGLSVSGIPWFAPFNKKKFAISEDSKFHFLVYKTNYYDSNNRNAKPTKNDKLKKRETIYLIVSMLLILLEIYFFRTQIGYTIKNSIYHNQYVLNRLFYHHRYYY